MVKLNNLSQFNELIMFFFSDYPLHLFSPVIALSNLVFVRSVSPNQNVTRARSASRR